MRRIADKCGVKAKVPPAARLSAGVMTPPPRRSSIDRAAVPFRPACPRERSCMHPLFPIVFRSIRLGRVELPNRYYFSPHGLPLTVGTAPSNDLVAYAAE